MKKTIPIDRLTVGMKVVGLDKSWIETRFLSHTFTIRSEQDIERLRADGISKVTVDLPDRTDPPPETPGSAPNPSGEEPLLEVNRLPLSKVQEVRALQEETARLLQKAFEQIRLKNALPTEDIRNHVRGTVAILLENPHAISFLSTIHDNDDETYVHSANTMILAAGFALRHRMSERDCVQWGLAAVLHDIGKTQVPQEILKKPSSLNAAEWEVMRRHPQMGFQILRKSADSDVHGLAAQVAVEHHERQNGSGYPHQLGLDQIHPVSRSLMVLDIYEALTADRVYREGLPPEKVIQYLLEGHQDKVSMPIILELAAMIGVYPIGTFIGTNKGEIGVILDYIDRKGYRGDARILFLFGEDRIPLSRPEARTVSELDPEKITRTYDYRELGFTSEQVELLLSKARKIT
ncbi:MAG: HD-GYP domain-containing protein [Leptospirales bacterium]